MPCLHRYPAATARMARTVPAQSGRSTLNRHPSTPALGAGTPVVERLSSPPRRESAADSSRLRRGGSAPSPRPPRSRGPARRRAAPAPQRSSSVANRPTTAPRAQHARPGTASARRAHFNRHPSTPAVGRVGRGARRALTSAPRPAPRASGQNQRLAPRAPLAPGPRPADLGDPGPGSARVTFPGTPAGPDLPRTGPENGPACSRIACRRS